LVLGAKVKIGSYNPHKFGFKNEDFFDGMHSLDSVYEKLFKNLKQQIQNYDLNQTL
jgi:hypothetical protein